MASSNRSVLATLVSTTGYLPYAKQLFSSAYFNGGWDGDFLLFAFDIPPAELTWFVDRGIIIFPCTRFLSFEPDVNPAALLCRLLLFSPYFKQWEHVVSLDCDMLVRASLDELKSVNGFYAVPDYPYPKLKHQVLTRGRPALDKEFRRSYDINSKTFNAGTMAFSTDIISESGFAGLIDLANRFNTAFCFADQSILNLWLYKKWKPLHIVYNTFCFFMDKRPDIRVAILHCLPIKPWSVESPYYQEWRRNYDRADKICIHKRVDNVISLSKQEMDRSAIQLKPYILTRVFRLRVLKRGRNFLLRCLHKLIHK